MMTSAQLTKDIIKYCILQGHYVVRVNNFPSRKYRKGNVTPGVSDIMGCTKDGRALAIEVKTTDQQSIYQKQFEEHYDSRGGIYILARKLEDVTDLI